MWSLADAETRGHICRMEKGSVVCIPECASSSMYRAGTRRLHNVDEGFNGRDRVPVTQRSYDNTLGTQNPDI